MLLVGCGGALGGPARWGVEQALPASPGGVPWGTLVVNLLGALLLGVVVALAARRWRTPAPRLLLGTGFLGAFTTFSTLVVEVDALRDGAPWLALGYGLGSVAAGLLLAAAGLAATGRLTPGSALADAGAR